MLPVLWYSPSARGAHSLFWRAAHEVALTACAEGGAWLPLRPVNAQGAVL